MTRPWEPKCPWCGGRNLRPEVEEVAASDRQDNVVTTHRCLDCAAKNHQSTFRVFPPDRPEVWP